MPHSSHKLAEFGAERMQVDQRIELDVAIQEFIEWRRFGTAQQMVFHFGQSLSAASRISSSMQMQMPGDKFIGHTAEQGDVQIEDEHEHLKPSISVPKTNPASAFTNYGAKENGRGSLPSS